MQRIRTTSTFVDLTTRPSSDQTAQRSMLAQYLWSTFLRGELSQIRDQMNSGRILKRSSNRDARTVGSTPNAVFTLPAKYGMMDCLQRLALPMPAPVAALVPIPSPAAEHHVEANSDSGADADDQEQQLISHSLQAHHQEDDIREIIMNATRRLHLAKAALGGDALLDFAPPQYAHRANEAFRDLGIPGLTYHNIWDVFALMLPVLTGRDAQIAGPSNAASAYM
jgi:hypothetical protein